MGIIARLRIGLALITILACTVAFVGIQRIVLISSTSADLERGTNLISKSTVLLSTVDQAEEAIIKKDRAGMREAVSQTMASYDEFHRDLVLWAKEDASARSTIIVLDEKFRSALTSWQAKVVRLHTKKTPPQETAPTTAAEEGSPPTPTEDVRVEGVEERRLRLAMRNLTSSLIIQLESGVASVRNDAAAGIRLLALLALALVGGVALIARAITFQLAQPLRRIELVLHKVATGADHRRTGLNSNDEIGRLGQAVDTMLSRLEFEDLNAQGDEAQEPATEVEASAPDIVPETQSVAPTQAPPTKPEPVEDAS